MIEGVPDELRRLGAGFDALLESSAGEPLRLASLAVAADECGRPDLAFRAAREARSLAPRDPEVRALTQGVLASGVQEWHVRMLRDDRRSLAYRAAIERLVRPGDRVLDIGSGSGLLAMIAARAGAAIVFSCEAMPAVAELAKEIVALNGLGDRVVVIPRRSTALDAVTDLGGTVDTLISEVIASDLIGENVLPTLEDAVRRLLKPGGRMLPLGGDVVIALAEASAGERSPLSVFGFDLSPMVGMCRRPALLPTGDPAIRLRSRPADLFRFDFTQGGNWGGHRASVPLTAEDGSANGVLMWMRLAIDEVETYESRPEPGWDSSWMLLFYPFDEPRRLTAGEIVQVEAVRRTASIQLWVSGGGGSRARQS